MGFPLDPEAGAEAAAEPSTTCPDANRSETWVTFILTFWPTFVPGTKMMNPSTLAMPSPRLLVSEILTSYSLPTSTGFLKDPEPLPKLPLFPYPPR